MLPVLGHVGLLCIFNLAERWLLTLLCVAIGFLGLLLAGPYLRGLTARSQAGLILAVALLLRVFLLPVLPSLSDDVYRYIWDGRVVGAGLNPYALAPEAPELVPLRDDLWTGMSHRDVPTVYPPLAQALFALSARLPVPVYAFKAILALLDLGACALLLMLAGRWNLPPERTIWYAWNPLVTVEIAGMGHVDGLGVALVILATTLLAWSGRHLLSAALAAAGAVLAKLVPVLAIPIWARQTDRSGSFAALALALSLAGLIPVFWSTSGPPPGLVEYGVSWEFNGPLFEPLWRIIDRADVHGPAQAGLDRLKDLTGRSEPWDHLYHYNYPQFWAKILLSLGLLISLFLIWRTRETLPGLRRVFGSVVIFSATVYPWYALWVLPWAALSRDRAWLSLSALLFLSYLPQFLDIPLFPWVHALIWLPFAMLLISGRR